MSPRDRMRLAAGVTCLRKRHFADRDAAEKSLAAMRASPGPTDHEKARLMVYRCQRCKLWLIGKPAHGRHADRQAG